MSLSEKIGVGVLISQHLWLGTVMILSFRTVMPGQTVRTQIRLQSDQGLHFCHSICIVWTHYSMAEPLSSSFSVITTNVLGVRIFRKFMVNVVFAVFQKAKS